MHYKSNANLIFFLRSITLQKRYCKNIYNDTYFKNILSVPRTVFCFLLPVHVIFVEHWNYFRSKTRRTKSSQPPILSYSQIYEFRVFREIRFLYEWTNSRCQQDQKDTIVVEVSGIAAGKRNDGGPSRCGTTLLEIVSPFLPAFFVPPTTATTWIFSIQSAIYTLAYFEKQAFRI